MSEIRGTGGPDWAGAPRPARGAGDVQAILEEKMVPNMQGSPAQRDFLHQVVGDIAQLRALPLPALPPL